MFSPYLSITSNEKQDKSLFVKERKRTNKCFFLLKKCIKKHLRVSWAILQKVVSELDNNVQMLSKKFSTIKTKRFDDQMNHRLGKILLLKNVDEIFQSTFTFCQQIKSNDSAV